MSFEQVVLIIVCTAFILTDWRMGIITFADFLLIIVFLLLLLSYSVKRGIRFKKIQIVLIILLNTITSLNLLFNLILNDNFDTMTAIESVVKVNFYLLTLIILFNFIRDNNLYNKFLTILSNTSVIVSLLGVYITFSIFLGGLLPYEFLWEFTRQDLESYTYRGWNRSIIRTRSLFGEPAHLGFYLNSILAILYFNKTKSSIKKSHDIIITITILLTFSISSILIMIGIKILYYFNWSKIISLLKKKRSAFSFIFTMVFIGFFWDTIEKTVFIRTQEILSGNDGSATARLEGSWTYINWDQIFIGNGIGNTPTIFNNYAYILSDLGLLSFLLFLVFSGWLVYCNPKLAIVFIALNFQKGGYLGAGYWILVFLIILFSNNSMKKYELREKESKG